jgi:predicted nucleotidyltransferase component of viral defense system
LSSVARYGFARVPFAVSSRWFESSCEIVTYELDELLGTKLRALYQRKKGRDLFDLATAMAEAGVNFNRITAAFSEYMARSGHQVTRAQFEQNIDAKLRDPQFAADISPLLSDGYTWNLEEAAERVSTGLIRLLPGDPWKGEG